MAALFYYFYQKYERMEIDYMRILYITLVEAVGSF